MAKLAHAAPTGSSPRVRGIDPPRHKKTKGLGIIPACAGNSSGVLGKERVDEDHPRVCGE